MASKFIKFLQMSAMLVLVVGLLAAFGGLTPILNSPALSETGNISDNAGNISDASSDARNYIETNGTIDGVSGQEVRVTYENDSLEPVETKLLGVQLVSNETEAGSFNASEDCYSGVVSNFEKYGDERLVNSTVRVFPVDYTNSTISVSQVIFSDSGEFVAAKLVSEGYAVVDNKDAFGDSTKEKMLEVQKSAQDAERGVWKCVPEDKE